MHNYVFVSLVCTWQVFENPITLYIFIICVYMYHEGCLLYLAGDLCLYTHLCPLSLPCFSPLDFIHAYLKSSTLATLHLVYFAYQLWLLIDLVYMQIYIIIVSNRIFHLHRPLNETSFYQQNFHYYAVYNVMLVMSSNGS